MSTIEKDLEYEKSQWPIANNLYLRQFGNIHPIIRYDYNDLSLGRQMQQSGTDCTIVINGERKNISEKFRSKDWGDVCIELYSVYENNVSGWALTDIGVDYYAFFHPDGYNEVYGKAEFISPKVIRRLAEQFKPIFDGDDELKRELVQYKRTKCIPRKVHGMNVKFINSYTTDKNTKRTYIGICVCIPRYEVKNLAKFMGEEYKEYLTVLKS